METTLRVYIQKTLYALCYRFNHSGENGEEKSSEMVRETAIAKRNTVSGKHGFLLWIKMRDPTVTSFRVLRGTEHCFTNSYRAESPNLCETERRHAQTWTCSWDNRTILQKMGKLLLYRIKIGREMLRRSPYILIRKFGNMEGLRRVGEFRGTPKMPTAKFGIPIF